ncbi:MAG: hypothetical protein HC811_02785 [Flammeovirgaceae bacterium]|nr:hypothetical protein [Flammeovirgaceae bacterium]
MPEKKRIKNLSTRWLKPFKVLAIGIYVTFCLMLLWMVLQEPGLKNIIFSLLQFGIYFYGGYFLIRMSAKLYHVEFDDEFLYVLSRKQDLIIPLENIRSVEISTLGGTYKVNLFNPEQLGAEFYFKPSLLYPLNYKIKDATVNLLRRNIDLAKRKQTKLPANALMS